MAMNGDTLAGEIKTALDGLLPEGSSEADLDYLKAIANAIVDHIKTNGQVSTTGVTGTGSPGGPLPITAQPGTIT